VKNFLGLLWHEPPKIELPSQLERMRERATTTNEGLLELLARIHEAQLKTGRLGLLLDLPEEPTLEALPYIALYDETSIINWDEGAPDDGEQDRLSLVVLDESGDERTDDFQWKHVERFRVLILGDGKDIPEGYSCAVYEDKSRGFDPLLLLQPEFRGTKLERIPFVFINAEDTTAQPKQPPLAGLARLCMTAYRGEADYRQTLFMQGQDTLVVVGGEENKTYQVGAGAAINVPIQGDAKYIGVQSAGGLAEQRQAIQADRAIASHKAGQLIDTRSSEKESGEALKLRLGAQTASLAQISRAAAAGLQAILRAAAIWVGADPNEVIVTPNLSFGSPGFESKSLVDLMTAKNMGAPIALESVHEFARKRGVTSKAYEEEIAAIESEEPIVPLLPAGAPVEDEDPADEDLDS
jgi:hypothetical protein